MPSISRAAAAGAAELAAKVTWAGTEVVAAADTVEVRWLRSPLLAGGLDDISAQPPIVREVFQGKGDGGRLLQACAAFSTTFHVSLPFTPPFHRLSLASHCRFLGRLLQACRAAQGHAGGTTTTPPPPGAGQPQGKPPTIGRTLSAVSADAVMCILAALLHHRGLAAAAADWARAADPDAAVPAAVMVAYVAAHRHLSGLQREQEELGTAPAQLQTFAETLIDRAHLLLSTRSAADTPPQPAALLRAGSAAAAADGSLARTASLLRRAAGFSHDKEILQFVGDSEVDCGLLGTILRCKRSTALELVDQVQAARAAISLREGYEEAYGLEYGAQPALSYRRAVSGHLSIILHRPLRRP